MHWHTRTDLSVRVVDNETIVFDRRQGRIHQLNPTASLIWACCDGQHSVDAIVAAVQRAFEVPCDLAVHDVHRLLHELQQHQLLILTPDATSPVTSKEITHGTTTPVTPADRDDPSRRP